MSAITLDQAKLYLRIDDTLDPDQEAELQSMIDASETFIERKTGYILTPKQKRYIASADGCIRIYDTPIEEDLTPFDFEEKNGYVIIYNQAPALAVQVGYPTVAGIPQDLINACLQMLKVWYYESEKQVNTSLIPEAVRQVIWNRKRFII